MQVIKPKIDLFEINKQVTDLILITRRKRIKAKLIEKKEILYYHLMLMAKTFSWCQARKFSLIGPITFHLFFHKVKKAKKNPTYNE